MSRITTQTHTAHTKGLAKDVAAKGLESSQVRSSQTNTGEQDISEQFTALLQTALGNGASNISGGIKGGLEKELANQKKLSRDDSGEELKRRISERRSDQKSDLKADRNQDQIAGDDQTDARLDERVASENRLENDRISAEQFESARADQLSEERAAEDSAAKEALLKAESSNQTPVEIVSKPVVDEQSKKDTASSADSQESALIQALASDSTEQEVDLNTLSLAKQSDGVTKPQDQGVQTVDVSTELSADEQASATEQAAPKLAVLKNVKQTDVPVQPNQFDAKLADETAQELAIGGKEGGKAGSGKPEVDQKLVVPARISSEHPEQSAQKLSGALKESEAASPQPFSEFVLQEQTQRAPVIASKDPLKSASGPAATFAEVGGLSKEAVSAAQGLKESLLQGSGLSAGAKDAVGKETHGVEKIATKTVLGSRSAEILERIQKIVVDNANQRDVTTVTIRLDPPSLGSVMVRLTQRGDDLLARIVPESKEVEQLLKSKSGEIVSALGASGIKLENVHVSIGMAVQDATGSFDDLMPKDSRAQENGSNSFGKDEQNGSGFRQSQALVTPLGVLGQGVDLAGWVA